MSKNLKILTSIFVFLEIILFFCVLFIGGEINKYLSFSVVALAFIFSLLFISKKSTTILTNFALFFTVIADVFLVLCVPQVRDIAMVSFSIVQIMYFARILIESTSKKLNLIHIILRSVLSVLVIVIALIVLKNNADFLSLISVFYFTNLVLNVIFAFLNKNSSKLFKIGLALFMCCDLFVGLQVAVGSYIILSENSLLYKIIFAPFNFVWFFYTPSQTLLSLSIINTKYENNEKVNKRKWWFELLKTLMKTRYKKPEFKFLGEEFENSSLILSNHEGTDAPMSLEMYLNKPIRMWGAHEMNSGLINMYKYQTKVYYHEKKGWNLTLARLFCLLASPLTNLFYKGLNLISTYKDGRFKKTLKESLVALEKGENIVVYPEDSSNGYLEELEGFYSGFVMLCEICYKKGRDLPIYVAYFKKKEKVFIFDKPVLYSTLLEKYKDRDKIAEELKNRCNELGKLALNNLQTKK